MLKPLAGNVIVRRAAAEKTTRSGLVIPETVKDTNPVFEGEVIAVGRGRITESGKLIEPEVHVGDHVLIGKARGYEVERDGEKLLVVNGDDVIAIDPELRNG